MGENTKIEWANHTINNFWGCRNNCSYCVARSIAKRFGRRIGTARGYSKEVIEKMANFEPIFLADQLQKLYTIKKPSRIFMSFMGEPFSPEFKQDMPYVFQAIKEARELGLDKRVATVLPDSRDRYLSEKKYTT